ncbi:MAG TPA: ClpX C4-type zinc finger protein [Candidatus Bathyarchaeia archaeon]|nr:ClpX C4-type zinc finger protein [Candidatus Bathyarchaeia archaeon]
MSNENTLTCSFCGKPQDEVSTLIAGPRAYVCEECVVVCVRVLKQNGIWPSPPVRLFRGVRRAFRSLFRAPDSN